MTLSFLICPSEVNPQALTSTSTAGVTTTYGVSNYGWCVGDWYVFGGLTTAMQNRSAFGVNASRRFATFTDGLSQSMLAAEVKAYQPAYHNCGGVPGPAGASPTVIPDPATILATVAAAPIVNARRRTRARALVQRRLLLRRLHHGPPPEYTGPRGEPRVDSDVSSIDEDDGGPTYAAVTSRSYHPGGINALFGDGSVHFVKNTIGVQVWRALGTIGGRRGGLVRLVLSRCTRDPGIPDPGRKNWIGRLAPCAL